MSDLLRTLNALAYRAAGVRVRRAGNMVDYHIVVAHRHDGKQTEILRFGPYRKVAEARAVFEETVGLHMKEGRVVQLRHGDAIMDFVDTDSTPNSEP